MDNKPLLQDRPPAYNAVRTTAACDYGSIPAAAAAPAFPQQPPPYPFPDGQVYAAPAAPAAAIGQQPNYNNTYTIIQPSVVVVGGCPACRVGVLEDDFTCLGIMCAILFFPLGILFCLALRQRRCPNCGATFG